jgi:hypothetical protein
MTEKLLTVADAIKKLKELRFDKSEEIEELRAEVKRLRAALKVARPHVPDGYALDIVDAALTKENET